MLHAAPTDLVAFFLFLPIVLATLLLWGVSKALARNGRGKTLLVLGLGLVAQFGIPAALCLSGVMQRWDIEPPPLMFTVVILFGVTCWFAFSRVGTALAHNLPIWVLVGSQAFRLPLEIMMHRAHDLGFMPVQMSYSGWNFDIITGISAGFLGFVLFRKPLPRLVVAGWNLLGSILLGIIVSIAVISVPTFAAFGPDAVNTWVAHFPFVWLPTVLVQAALLGHILVLRRLLHLRRLDPTALAT